MSPMSAFIFVAGSLAQQGKAHIDTVAMKVNRDTIDVEDLVKRRDFQSARDRIAANPAVGKYMLAKMAMIEGDDRAAIEILTRRVDVSFGRWFADGKVQGPAYLVLAKDSNYRPEILADLAILFAKHGEVNKAKVLLSALIRISDRGAREIVSVDTDYFQDGGFSLRKFECTCQMFCIILSGRPYVSTGSLNGDRCARILSLCPEWEQARFYVECAKCLTPGDASDDESTRPIIGDQAQFITDPVMKDMMVQMSRGKTPLVWMPEKALPRKSQKVVDQIEAWFQWRAAQLDRQGRLDKFFELKD